MARAMRLLTPKQWTDRNRPQSDSSAERVGHAGEWTVILPSAFLEQLQGQFAKTLANSIDSSKDARLTHELS